MGTQSTTDQNFENEVLKSELPVLVDFWAEWCGPCRNLAPKLEQIASELEGKVRVVKVNVDENPSSPAKYGVRGIPTMILFEKGQVVEQLVGDSSKEKILEVLNKHT